MEMPNIQGNSLVGANGAINGDILVIDAVWKASQKYDVNFGVMWDLCLCESGGKKTAIGYSGKAVSIFQWWQSSWDYYNQVYGMDLNRMNVYDQAEMTARVLKDGGHNNWYNCFKYKVSADLI